MFLTDLVQKEKKSRATKETMAKAAAKAAAAAEYYTIVRRCCESEPDDGARVLDLLEQAGKTEDDLTRDTQRVMGYRHARTRPDSPEKLAAIQLYTRDASWLVPQ